MNETTDWMTTKWRPMMAWVYMAINVCDFILFPVLFSTLQTNEGGALMQQWQPITLHAGGFIHLAFGAILGITAWTRGQEKIESLKAGKEDA